MTFIQLWEPSNMTQGVISIFGQPPPLDFNALLTRHDSMFLSHVSHQEDGLHLRCREVAHSTFVHAHLLLFDLDGRQNDKLNVVSSQHVSTASYFSISQWCCNTIYDSPTITFIQLWETSNMTQGSSPSLSSLLLLTSTLFSPAVTPCSSFMCLTNRMVCICGAVKSHILHSFTLTCSSLTSMGDRLTNSNWSLLMLVGLVSFLYSGYGIWAFW